MALRGMVPVTVVLLWALIATGCREESSTGTSGGVRLVYWPPPNRFDVEMSRELVEAWNRTHPEIQVELQPLPAGRSSEEVLLASIVGGTTPDICSNILTGTVERMVQAGALVPLSKRFADYESYLRQRLPEGALEPFRNADGSYYQLPWKANPMLLLYNTKLLAAEGLGPPRTYSEALRAAARLTRDTDGDGRVDRWAFGLSIENTWWKRFDDLLPLYLGASQGRTLVERGRVLFDGPAMVSAFSFLRALFARGYAPRSYFALDLFLQGRVAMVTGTAPSLPDLEAKKPPGLSFDFAPVPVPDGTPEPSWTFGDLKSMVVFSSCRHPEAAWTFLKYLTSAEADLLLLTRASQIPLRRGLFESEPFASALRRLPLLAKAARRVGRIRGADDTPHLVEILDTLSQAYEGSAIHGLTPPAEAVKKAARRVEQILERWD